MTYNVENDKVEYCTREIFGKLVNLANCYSPKFSLPIFPDRLCICTDCSLLCTDCSLLCTDCSLLCTDCSLLCTDCSLLCTDCSLLYTDCSLFAKFFLANSFYLYCPPKFSPHQIFPVYGRCLLIIILTADGTQCHFCLTRYCQYIHVTTRNHNICDNSFNN